MILDVHRQGLSVTAALLSRLKAASPSVSPRPANLEASDRKDHVD